MSRLRITLLAFVLGLPAAASADESAWGTLPSRPAPPPAAQLGRPVIAQTPAADAVAPAQCWTGRGRSRSRRPFGPPDPAGLVRPLCSAARSRTPNPCRPGRRGSTDAPVVSQNWQRAAPDRSSPRRPASWGRAGGRTRRPGDCCGGCGDTCGCCGGCSSGFWSLFHHGLCGGKACGDGAARAVATAPSATGPAAAAARRATASTSPPSTCCGATRGTHPAAADHPGVGRRPREPPPGRRDELPGTINLFGGADYNTAARFRRPLHGRLVVRRRTLPRHRGRRLLPGQQVHRLQRNLVRQPDPGPPVLRHLVRHAERRVRIAVRRGLPRSRRHGDRPPSATASGAPKRTCVPTSGAALAGRGPDRRLPPPLPGRNPQRRARAFRAGGGHRVSVREQSTAFASTTASTAFKSASTPRPISAAGTWTSRRRSPWATSASARTSPARPPAASTG